MRYTLVTTLTLTGSVRPYHAGGFLLTSLALAAEGGLVAAQDLIAYAESCVWWAMRGCVACVKLSANQWTTAWHS